DLETDASSLGSQRPFGSMDMATVMGLRATLGREGRKVVLAEEQRGSGAERDLIQRPAHRPFVGMAERRRRGLVQSDIVPVATGKRTLASMKPRHHGRQDLDPAVTRQEGVQGTPQR